MANDASSITTRKARSMALLYGGFTKGDRSGQLILQPVGARSPPTGRAAPGEGGRAPPAERKQRRPLARPSLRGCVANGLLLRLRRRYRLRLRRRLALDRVGHQADVHAAVLGAAGSGAVGGDRLVFAQADQENLVRGHVRLRRQVLDHGRGAPLAQIVVVVLVADGVRAAF